MAAIACLLLSQTLAQPIACPPVIAKHKKDPLKTVIPKYQTVLEGFKVDPEVASDETKEAMSFFLNYAVPAVDPKILRSWVKKQSSHFEAFGEDCWSHDMATALVLLAWFSDTNNMKYNAGLIDDNGEVIEIADDNIKPMAPKRKRRKKMHTKLDVKKLQAFFFAAGNHFRTLQKTTGFVERARAWDDLVCGERGRKAAVSGSKQGDIVPHEHLPQADDCDSLARAYLQNSQLAKHWAFLDSCATSSTGSSSPGSSSSEESPFLITQERLMDGTLVSRSCI